MLMPISKKRNKISCVSKDKFSIQFSAGSVLFYEDGRRDVVFS